MASFLDQPTQFTPYRDPFNLDLYTKVGVTKQAQYNEGLQRVQGYVDSVAGLQVAREEDKQYLNQKIGQLQTTLQEFTKNADFSQISTVNQAAGLASQIYSDRRIQKDVASAQNYSDAVGQIQKAHQEGKSATSNDNALLRNIQAWQTGGAEASLGKQQYTNYYNYSKAWQDYMSSKHANSVYWETDSTGKSSLGVAYTINQGKKTYIDPATVQRDFQTFLQMDAQAAGQVQIDALYYADKTPDEIAFQGLRNNAQSTLNSLNTSLEILEQQKASLTSNEDLAILNQKIRDTQAERDKYRLRLENGDLDREFSQDPHSAKMSLFMQNLSVGAANRYAYSEIENKTVKNPEFDARLDETRLQIAQTELDISLRKEARELQEVQGTGNLNVGGIPIVDPDTPEQIIQGITSMGSKVVQNQLEALYNTGNMDSLVTLGVDGVYRISPGKTQNDFNQAWKDVVEGYYKNPQYAKPSIRRFMEATDNPEYGLGLSNIYNARKASLNKIETQLDQRFSNDPNYRNYITSLGNLGDLNEILLTENGISITRNDLVKYANGIKKAGGSEGRNFSNIEKNSGLDRNKIEIISRRAQGQLQGFGDIGKAILSGGFYDPSDPRNGGLSEEYNKISNLVNAQDSEYSKARREAYKPLVPLNKPTISYSSNVEGPEKKRNADLISAFETILSDPTRSAEREKFISVLNAKNKGELEPVRTVGVERDPTTGKVRGFLLNSASTEKVYIDIGPENAQLRFPQFVQLDRDAMVNEDLQAQAVTPNQETTTIATYYPTQGVSNLKNYSLRYKVRGNPDSQRYSPQIQFWKQGLNEWQDLGYGGTYFNSPSQVKNFIDQIASQGDNYLEKTFLSR